MAKKTTVYDIAKELNITVSTVSRALNNISTISEATRKAVQETAIRLNYRPNKIASSLTSGKTYTIGVIIPSAQVQYFASVIHALETSLKSFGYSILLYQSNESLISEKNGITTLLEAQVDGIVASMSLETKDPSHFEKVKEEGKPLIIFDRTHDDLQCAMVKIDDVRAGYIATKHLLDEGYRKIAYITTAHKIKIFNERYEGYLLALQEAGLPANPAYTISGNLTVEGGYTGTQQLLKLREQPDAIIGGDDYVALGIIKALHEKNITPPEIGVIGFANQNFSEHIIPSLSTIDQQALKIGAACATMFLKIIDQSLDARAAQKPVVIEPLLLARESTRRTTK
ncbi:LacI family DNA-binding transcriptional regulator [Sphingobacterium sp. FBM7-1]|uniref:LacI family DNA-binding transcriptional regulator n=1 Tax=Sphingobacterium sp. FBM7-1 TaxID=2886688 RepID=UPI001D1292AD|nr:LacI family DNA-binding transcriptional regulator [Sphingobacterium sp. FBM7-1]MCC2598489.1 LacI family transcriptional regulator [Sphingobacterium sp. FBM7-1]